jgi:hypothetical protein
VITYRLNIVLLLILFWVMMLTAQDGSFITSVDRNRLAMGEQLEITFTLTGTGGGSNFRSPSFNDFVVLSGPNQSTSMQIINGAVSSSVSYSYVLQPRAEGKFTIGAATIDYGGKQLQSQPVVIEVTKGVPAPKQQGQASGESDISKQIGDNLFLKVTVDKPRGYQGEQLTATYKIYNRINIVNLGISKTPALSGFWSEDLPVPQQIQWTTEVVNGKQYRVGVLKKVALFPQRSGTLDLDPMEVNCVVQVQTRKRSNDFFDQFFNDPFFGNVTNVNHKIRNELLKITVLPLPASNNTKGFNGAVGTFTMEAWLDKRQVKTNDPVTLKVKISGRGNLKLLEPPAVNISPDLEKYDPKIADNISNQGNLIAGSRTFEYLLIPRHAGELKIPSFSFSYFDVEKKSYIALASPEFILSVEKGTEMTAGVTAGLAKEDVKLLGEDIRFIKSGNISFRRKGDSFVGSVMFYFLSLGPILCFVGFIFYMKRREKVLEDVRSLHNRKARKMAQRRMVAAQKCLQEKKKEEFYTEVSRAIWGYAADKLGISPAELSADSIRVSLVSRNVPEEIVSKLISAIENCEFARFAPSSDSMQMDIMYREAVELISTIEDQIR